MFENPLLLGIFWTLVLIGSVMLTAGLTSTKVILWAKYFLFAGIIWVAFARSFPSVIQMFHFPTVWYQNIYTYPMGIICFVVNIVFTFGGIVITTQEIDIESKKVRLYEGSTLHTILVKFAGFDPTIHDNLCKFSWFGVTAIAFGFLLTTLFNVAKVLIGFVVAVVYGANPIKYLEEAEDMGIIFRPELKYLGWFPLSPIMILTLLGTIGIMLWYCIDNHIVVATLVLTIGAFLFFAICYLVFWLTKNAVSLVKSTTGKRDREVETNIVSTPIETQPSALTIWWHKTFVPNMQESWNHFSAWLVFVLIAGKKRVCLGIELIKFNK